MKRMRLAGAALLALTVQSMAADLSAYGPAPLPLLGAPWAGCYGGGNLGGMQADANVNWTPDLAGFPKSGPELQEYGPDLMHATGVTGGAQVGCNYQGGGLAWGAEADFGYTGVSATRNVTTAPLNPAAGIFVPSFNVARAPSPIFSQP
jgi:outer membrane immunogenic protein